MKAFVERTDRTLIRMFGRDPLKMIQGLATNDIAGAAENTSVYTAFLTPKGKMVGDARVVRRPGGDIWIEADRAAAENIVANLKKFVPPLFARFEPLAGYRVVELIGVPADAVPHEVALNNPFRGDSVAVVVADSAAISVDDVQPLSLAELDVIRIEAGEPKWGAELSEDVIPLEAGLRHHAISESKGCYTGQEVIIRILHRGHVNRHLRGLLTGRAAVPQPGDELSFNDKVIGRVTSAVYSEKYLQAIALAYVRREVTPGSMVKLGDRHAEVVELPFGATA